MREIHDPYFGKTMVILDIGELFCCSEDILICTNLGSCVSVCLRDPLTGVAGMNHFLLPHVSDERVSSAHRGRYGALSIEFLFEQVVRKGGEAGRLQGKIFGGGRPTKIREGGSIAQANVELALKTLKRLKIPVVASDVGGDFGRKIVFHTGTGRVSVHVLQRKVSEQVARSLT